MRIEYRDGHDSSDPLNQTRVLSIEFDLPEERAALNRQGTRHRIIPYIHRAVNAFLADNRNYGSQLDNGRYE